LFSSTAFASAPAQLLEKAPIRFEPNGGQVSPSALWTARGPGYAFAFTRDATLLHFADRTIRLKLDGANPSARYAASDQASVSTSYFLGGVRATVPGFHKLRRIGVYPGIDMIYYGAGRQLEYDFEIAPGADPSRIGLRFEGADAIRLNGRGEVVLSISSGEVTQRVPVVYQRRSSGAIVSVEAHYLVADGDPGMIRLSLGGYDPAEPLIVDPTLLFTTYLTGSGFDSSTAIAHDSHGFYYVGGDTYSTDFELVGDSYNVFDEGNRDTWVMKLNPLASSPDQIIVYSTYYGGTGSDFLKSLAVDAAGVIYFGGATSSSDIPMVNSYASANPNSNNVHGFFAVIDPAQSGAAGLLYSTYFGGTNTDEIDGIAVGGGKVYLTGFTNSSDFPKGGPYASAYVAGQDAFVAEFDISQGGASSLAASAYLSGSADDYGRAVAVDTKGLVYVAGSTFSPDFPISANANQSAYTAVGDIFLTQIDLNAGKIVYSTYLGGSGVDEAKRIFIEPSGRVALTGYTLSPDFPITQNAAQPLFGGTQNTDGTSNAFLSILDPTAQSARGLVYSTYFGGSGGEIAYGLSRDSSGNYVLGGFTISTDLPVTTNALNPVSAGGGSDGFLAVINPSAPPLNSLVYSSYITSPGLQSVSGVDVDAAGNIYVTGSTTSNIFSFPKPSSPGDSDAFLLVLSLK
jgi:hypothetical protein